MSMTVVVAIVIVVLVLIGGLVAWRLMGGSSGPVQAPPGAADQGYGQGRWEREQELWAGTLRRLQTQAARYPEIPPRLQREIAHAEARLERARAGLAAPPREGAPNETHGETKEQQ